jgi:hypothetical protein
MATQDPQNFPDDSKVINVFPSNFLNRYDEWGGTWQKTLNLFLDAKNEGYILDSDVDLFANFERDEEVKEALFTLCACVDAYPDRVTFRGDGWETLEKVVFDESYVAEIIEFCKARYPIPVYRVRPRPDDVLSQGDLQVKVDELTLEVKSLKDQIWSTDAYGRYCYH